MAHITTAQFRQLVQLIFDNVNRQLPSETTIAMWEGTCRYMPAESIPWITEKFMAMDNLPLGNLGKKILDMSSEWEDSYAPKDEFRRGCCDQCDPKTPGFFTAWKPGPYEHFHPVLVKCSSNKEKMFDHMPSSSPHKVEEHGWVVFPRSWKGTMQAFEDQFITKTTREKKDVDIHTLVAGAHALDPDF